LLSIELAAVKQQLDWFKCQLFGAKSEKRLKIDPAIQDSLFEGLGLKSLPQKEPDTENIVYQRRKKCRDGAVTDSGLRFGDEVPKKVFVLEDPEIQVLSGDQCEVTA
jgi:transposase